MRKEYDNFIEAIEAATDSAVEYESSHTDAGDNYAHCVPDGLTYNNGDARFADWLELHGIDRKHAEECLQYIVDTGSFEMQAGSIFGPFCAKPFYSKDEYHHSEPESFLCDSYAVQEIETQLELSSLTSSRYAPQFAQLAENNNRVCTRYTKGESTLLSYEATDAVWFAIVELETVKDWLEGWEA